MAHKDSRIRVAALFFVVSIYCGRTVPARAGGVEYLHTAVRLTVRMSEGDDGG